MGEGNVRKGGRVRAGAWQKESQTRVVDTALQHFFTVQGERAREQGKGTKRERPA